jgi:hypothetical protein
MTLGNLVGTGLDSLNVSLDKRNDRYCFGQLPYGG